MMGHQHALSGAALWLAATPALHASYGLTHGQEALGFVVCAGGAMLPDLDQRGSSIGRTYGPVTNVVARLVAFVSGGHRNGTHSVLGWAAFTGLAIFATGVGGWLEAIVLWVTLGVAVRGLRAHKPAPGVVSATMNAVSMGIVTGLVMLSGVALSTPLIVGTALGVAAHIAGDMLTPEGCPLLWPIQRARFGVSVVTTGSKWTSWLVTAVLTVAVVVLAVMLTPAGVLVEQVARMVV